MDVYTVVAEFDGADRARESLDSLSLAGLSRSQLEVCPEPADRPVITVRSVGEEDARRASIALARLGAVRMQWTDGAGGDLRGPGRAHESGGWRRPVRVRQP